MSDTIAPPAIVSPDTMTELGRQVGAALRTLTDPVLWARAGTLLLGIGLIIIGVVMLIAGDKTVQSAATTVVKAVT